jgi:Predicted transcriptional regulators
MNTTDLLSIKDFSKFTGIPQSTLRYYDDIGLFHPVMRGENNYRFYSCQQIITVNLINTLAALEIPRKEIMKLTASRTPEGILQRFSEQKEILANQTKQINIAYSIINTFQTLIEQGLSANEDEFVIETIPATPITLGTPNQFFINEQFYDPFIKYCDYAESIGVNLSYPIGGYYEDMDIFIAEPSRPTKFFSLNPNGEDLKPAGRYLIGYVRGYYGEMGDFPTRLNNYAKEHKLKTTGPLYVVYLHDEISKNDFEYLAQISMLLEKD